MLMEDEIKGQEVTQPETQSETPPKKVETRYATRATFKKISRQKL